MAAHAIDKAKKAEQEMLRAEAVREANFVAHYSVYANGAAAVRHAYEGYERGGPHAGNERFLARDLLTKPHIQRAIVEKQAQLGDLHFNLANELTRDLAAMNDALSDTTRLYDANGNLLDPAEWPDDLKGCIAGMEIEERMVGQGDAAEMVRTTKVKLVNRVAVIGTLGKVSGAIIERSQQLGADGRPMGPVAPIISVTVTAPTPTPPKES